MESLNATLIPILAVRNSNPCKVKKEFWNLYKGYNMEDTLVNFTLTFSRLRKENFENYICTIQTTLYYPGYDPLESTANKLFALDDIKGVIEVMSLPYRVYDDVEWKVSMFDGTECQTQEELIKLYGKFE